MLVLLGMKVMAIRMLTLVRVSLLLMELLLVWGSLLLMEMVLGMSLQERKEKWWCSPLTICASTTTCTFIN